METSTTYNSRKHSKKPKKQSVCLIKISVRESEVIEIINENQIEPIFKVEKVTINISKSAIKEAIKSGINVNGVVIKKNKSLQIK